MAAVAGIWGTVVITVVTHRAITGNRNVSPIQCIIIVVNRERRRFPARRRRMAHGAIRREVQCYVVWVGCLVKIGSVATITRIGRVRIITVVTGIAIICNRDMRSGKWVDGTMVKSRWHPGCLRVATGAIG